MVFDMLFSRFGGAIKGLTPGQRSGGGPANIEGGLGVPEGFTGSSGRRDLERSDFWVGNVTMSANNGTNFEELGGVLTGRQEALRWGFGVPGDNQNQGLINFDPQNPALGSTAGTALNGKVRLMWKDNNKLRTDVVKEFTIRTLRGTAAATDKQTQVFLPEQPVAGLATRNYAAPDEFLSLDVKMDAASNTFNATGSTVVISSTRYFR